MIDERGVAQAVQGHSIIASIDRVRNGHLRIETAFLYPDGHSIDVFVQSDREPQPSRVFPLVLSDLGQTTAWLLGMDIRPWKSTKRRDFVEGVLTTFGIRQVGAMFEMEVAHERDFFHAVIALAQACLRIADLMYTKRLSFQTDFAERVESIFVDADLDYEPKAILPGKFGNDVEIDYRVKGRTSTSLVNTMTATVQGGAVIAADEVLRKWYDLSDIATECPRVTLFDDSRSLFRDADLNRLGSLSIVIPVSAPDRIRDTLSV